jgi:hypothetical protein
MAKRKKRYGGHYCWCCGRIRPNEQFSGKGHARHVCKACARLGADELVYRQALRNLERCMDINTIIPRTHRASFDRFLTHKDPRIRAAAREMQERDAQTRTEWSAVRRQEQEREVHTLDTWGWGEASASELRDARDGEDFCDDEPPC